MALTNDQLQALAGVLAAPRYLPLLGQPNNLHFFLNAPTLTSAPDDGTGVLPGISEFLSVIPGTEKRNIMSQTWFGLAADAYVDAEAETDAINEYLVSYPAQGSNIYDVAIGIMNNGNLEMAGNLISVMLAGGIISADTVAALGGLIQSHLAGLYEYGPSPAEAAGLPVVSVEDVTAAVALMA